MAIQHSEDEDDWDKTFKNPYGLIASRVDFIAMICHVDRL